MLSSAPPKPRQRFHLASAQGVMLSHWRRPARATEIAARPRRARVGNSPPARSLDDGAQLLMRLAVAALLLGCGRSAICAAAHKTTDAHANAAAAGARPAGRTPAGAAL